MAVLTFLADSSEGGKTEEKGGMKCRPTSGTGYGGSKPALFPPSVPSFLSLSFSLAFLIVVVFLTFLFLLLERLKGDTTLPTNDPSETLASADTLDLLSM